MRIKVNLKICTGCRLCEVVCSTLHNPVGLLNPSQSAIQIRNDSFHRKDVASVCYQCKKAHCMDICTTQALYRGSDDEAIKFNPDLCNGCQDCVIACPFELIWPLPFEKSILKCDLCEQYSEQYCLTTCPVDAITLAGRKPQLKSKL